MTVATLLAGCSDDNESSEPEAVAARPSTGCNAPAVEPGKTEVTITSRATSRSYFRHVPPAVSEDRPLPVVVDLHGYSEPPDIHTKLTALGPYGDEHGFVTVTPRGGGSPIRWETQFESDDVAFIGDLLDDVEAALCIDEARVFVTGLSNGALMTSTLACVLAERVAAIAPVAGVRNPSGCKPSRRVPVLAIHGTDDQFIRYDGGLGESGLDLPAPDGSGRKIRELIDRDSVTLTPVPQVIAAWARRNGCDPKPATVKVTADVDRISYDCPVGVDVQLYRVNGGGHSWPGSPFAAALSSIVGKTTTSISANDVMWRFFQRHPLS